MAKRTIRQPANWASTPNARRRRPMVTLTLDPGTLELIDRVRGERSRGEYIDEIVWSEAAG